MNKTEHAAWLQNEYQKWCDALQNAYIETFKQDPMIRRMMGLDDEHQEFIPLISKADLPWGTLCAMDRIGFGDTRQGMSYFASQNISGIGLRFIYYANKILDLIPRTGSRIVEIGGGYGGFAATLNIIAAHRGITIDRYTILDLPEVLAFQQKYIDHFFSDQSAIGNFSFINGSAYKETAVNYDIALSFYALGEFTGEMKEQYIERLLKRVPHGFFIWNAHSGADNSEIDLLMAYHPSAKIKSEDPLTSEGNLEINY